ncbi:MAG: Acyl-[acyl-carrier-protein]--UDP-N-acetylglucosamine O-acyltransferase [Planctomycetota bacterium]|jgi:UDP-N-acetylglucosamine acyltransferase
MASIHPTAVIDCTAEIADDAVVGPWCVIGPKVTVGPRSILRNHVVIESHTRIGSDNVLYPFASIGGTPQDRKYRGEETWCELGDRNHIREQVTIHRGTAVGGGCTRIGSGNLLMVGAHVAHDCQLGDDITIANAVLFAGHVRIGDGATIGGNAAFHHFVTIGTCALVGGLARVAKDVPPYMIAEGSPARVRGHNHIQMARRGMSEAAIDAVRTAYRRLFCEAGAAMTTRLEELRAEYPDIPQVHELCDALVASANGVHGRAYEALRPDDKRSVPKMWQPQNATEPATPTIGP